MVIVAAPLSMKLSVTSTPKARALVVVSTQKKLCVLGVLVTVSEFAFCARPVFTPQIACHWNVWQKACRPLPLLPMMSSLTIFTLMIWRLACVAAMCHGQANRSYNVVDDSDLKMADYFDQVADAFALPHPPRLSREAASAALSPMQMSFMRESRRIGNRRIKQELKLRLAFPTVADGIADALKGNASC
jgi:hypothetical protein